MLEKAREQARERRLGSDARAGRRVRDEIRRTQWAYIRRHWGFIGTGVLAGALLTAFAAYVASNVFVRGAVVGAGVVIVLGGLEFTVFLFTGSGPQLMGAVAETWTSSELRPLRKHGWKLVDHVFYRFADVDHLLVGPGGALVVETKWSADAWRLDEPDRKLLDHLDGLQRRAKDVRMAIRQLRREETPVRVVLFVWGGGRTGADLPARPVRVAGVEVVYGVAAAKAWRDALDETPRALSNGDIDDVWTRIRKQAAETDKLDATDPPPPTLARLYWTACATGVAASLGCSPASTRCGCQEAVSLGSATRPWPRRPVSCRVGGRCCAIRRWGGCVGSASSPSSWLRWSYSADYWRAAKPPVRVFEQQSLGALRCEHWRVIERRRPAVVPGRNKRASWVLMCTRCVPADNFVIMELVQKQLQAPEYGTCSVVPPAGFEPAPPPPETNAARLASSRAQVGECA